MTKADLIKALVNHPDTVELLVFGEYGEFKPLVTIAFDDEGRLRLLNEDSLIESGDYQKCPVCDVVKHVDEMLQPNRRADELCCSDSCCETFNDRGRP